MKRFTSELVIEGMTVLSESCIMETNGGAGDGLVTLFDLWLNGPAPSCH